MLELLDIRTLSLSNLVFSFIFGSSLIYYGLSHNKYRGVSLVGFALLCFGSSFLLIGLRQLIHDFFSIVIANLLICAGFSLIYSGLNHFHKVTVSKEKHLAIILLTLIFLTFSYYTFWEPQTNFRIIIISACLALQSFLCSNTLLYKNQLPFTTSSKLLGIIYLIFGLVLCFRIFWSISEETLTDFMQAGFIHAITILIFQAIILLTSFTVLWLANSQLEEELKEQARIDPLTLIYNRRALEEFASIEITRSTRNQQPLSLIMCDIDYFKVVNDTYGHAVGDTVLVEFATTLKLNIRETDFVARYGGEEFLLLLPETNHQQANKIAEKLRQEVEKHKIYVKKGQFINITASFGTASLHHTDNSWQSILKVADKALYQAKNAGRNCVISKKIAA